MPETETADYAIVVTEGFEGEAGLTLEPRGEDLSILENASLTFWLKEGIDVHEAADLARQLRKAVDKVAYTDLSDVPGAGDG